MDNPDRNVMQCHVEKKISVVYLSIGFSMVIISVWKITLMKNISIVIPPSLHKDCLYTQKKVSVVLYFNRLSPPFRTVH